MTARHSLDQIVRGLDGEPVAKQWRCVEDGEPRTAWHDIERGDHAGWKQYADRSVGVVVEYRELYTEATVRETEARATAAEATVAALQEALEPFANSDMAPDTYDDDSFVAGSCDFTCGDVRRARAALSQIRSEK